MELKKSNCTYALNIPDYDSTKANFDELEKRIKSNDVDMCDGLTQLEDAIIGLEDRLTALEAQAHIHQGPCIGIGVAYEKLPAACGNCSKGYWKANGLGRCDDLLADPWS